MQLTLVNMEKIVCAKCGVAKGFDDFNLSAKGKHGRQAYCRECFKAYNYARWEPKRKEEERKQREKFPEEGMQTCSSCKVVKAYEEFAKDSMSKIGIRSDCKECRRGYNKSYYKINSDHLKNEAKSYRDMNEEKVKECSRNWRINNPEKQRESSRRKYRNKPEKYRKIHRKSAAKWRKNNIARARELNVKSSHKRRALIAGGITGPYPTTMQLLAKQGGRCAWCGRKESRIPKMKNGVKWHTEHIDPISNLGPDIAGNVCAACWQCNLTKGSKTPEQWAAENGRLL